MVAGLPRSWSSAASRTTGRPAGAASTVRSVWSKRSSPSTLFWGTPRCASSSGRTTARSPVVGHQSQPGRGPVRREQLPELRGDPLAGHVGGQRRVRANRLERRRLDRELEHGGEPDRADHPQRVLAEPRGRITDRPKDPRLDVGDASERIDDRRAGRAPGAAVPGRGRGAPGDGVDREVAPGEVELDVVAELDPVGTPEVGVVVIGPEGRDLVDRVALADRHGPELVLVDGAREDGQQPVGSRVRGEVPVARQAGRGARPAPSRRRRTPRGRAPTAGP